MSAQAIKEIQDRVRRMETRLTKWLEDQGFDTGVKRPVWHQDGTVTVPSLDCSLKHILTVIPGDWDADEEVAILFHNTQVASVMLPPTKL
jgi:hypothetical protein